MKFLGNSEHTVFEEVTKSNKIISASILNINMCSDNYDNWEKDPLVITNGIRITFM